MRFLADVYIAPATVRFLRSLGHDVVRVDDRLAASAPDAAILETAAQEGRCVLT
jgi:predicted nuclease of predicted toxin-antitoxin system